METTYKRMHPQKFLMWLAVGSLTMMFAGFTSAYLVQKSQKNWYTIDLPFWFYLSTVLILASSFSLVLAKRLLKNGHYGSFRKMLLLTFLLGVLFVITQGRGFSELAARGLFLAGDNVASSFMYVIVGLHVLHVLGGLFAFIFILIKYLSTSKRYYTTTPIEIFAVYWHFVDVLWIYLLFFFYVQS